MIKKLVIWLVFSGLEKKHYLEALKIKQTKGKIYQASIKLADEKHDSDGKRYYVVDTYKQNKDFLVINSDEINFFKRQGKISKSITFAKLTAIAGYRTKD